MRSHLVPSQFKLSITLWHGGKGLWPFFFGLSDKFWSLIFLIWFYCTHALLHSALTLIMYRLGQVFISKESSLSVCDESVVLYRYCSSCPPDTK